jgi:hypothetical protein
MRTTDNQRMLLLLFVINTGDPLETATLEGIQWKCTRRGHVSKHCTADHAITLGSTAYSTSIHLLCTC